MQGATTAIDDCVAAGTWVNAAVSLPSTLEGEDISAVLEGIPAIAKGKRRDLELVSSLAKPSLMKS